MKTVLDKFKALIKQEHVIYKELKLGNTHVKCNIFEHL
jgi:hypothetical protein